MKISRPFMTSTTLNLDHIKLKLISKHQAEEQITAGFMQSIGELASLFKSMNLDKINDVANHCVTNIPSIKRIEFTNPKTDNTIIMEL